MMVTDWMVPVFTNMLKKKEIPFEIHIQNVETVIKETYRKNEEVLWHTGDVMNWKAFHSYDTVNTIE